MESDSLFGTGRYFLGAEKVKKLHLTLSKISKHYVLFLLVFLLFNLNKNNNKIHLKDNMLEHFSFLFTPRMRVQLSKWISKRFILRFHELVGRLPINTLMRKP